MNARDPLLDSVTNPRFYAWFRIAVGSIAVAKGLLLLIGGADPLLVVPWMVLGALVALGYRARLAAVLMLGVGPFLLIDWYRNHLYLILILLLLVAVSDCERHYALRLRGSGPATGWPRFLMRCQVSIVYVFAGIAKVNGEFLDGRVLQHYFDRSIFPVPDLDQSTLAAISVSAVTVELFMGLAVWLPRLRPVVFFVAIPLHLTMIPISSTPMLAFELGIFALLMFTLLGAFVDVEERARLVVWDDTCTFCRRWVATFQRLDLFGALRFTGASSPAAYEGFGVTPEAAAHALQLVEPRGDIGAGYDAVAAVTAVLPLGFLIAPWMAVPGVRHAGRRAYARVAARRTCGLQPALVGSAARSGKRAGA